MEKEILKAQALKKKTGQEFFPLECFIALHWKHFHRTEHFFFNISISLWLSARLALTLSLNLANLFWWTSVWMPRSFLTLSSMISTSSVALRSWCLSTEARPSLNFWYSVAVTTFWFSNRLIRLLRAASSCFSFSKHWTSTFLTFSVLKKYSYITHFKWTWTWTESFLYRATAASESASVTASTRNRIKRGAKESTVAWAQTSKSWLTINQNQF